MPNSMNRIPKDYTPDTDATPVDEVQHGFLRVGTACAAWVSVGSDRKYIMRFDSRKNMTDILRESMRLLDIDGFSYYLAAILTKEIRHGLLKAKQ